MLYGQYQHVHVSERQPGAWLDCRWMSAVEFVNAVEGCPATHEEGDALRADSGDLIGGSNMGDQIRGMLKRYGWIGEVKPNTDILKVPVGHAVTLDGNMGAFFEGHRLRRWDPTFAGDHAVAVFRLPRGWWWCDPLAPRFFGPKPQTEYTGQWVVADELRAFVAALPGGKLMHAAIDSRRRDDYAVDKLKLEDWRAIGGNGVLRRQPVRSSTPYARLEDGTIIRSVGELTTKDGNNWRLTSHAGGTAWMLRSDWEPLVPGGDPAVDAILKSALAREPLVTQDTLEQSVNRAISNTKARARVVFDG